MAKPAPEGGMVFRYDYLWKDDAAEGREEGSKLRPCVLAVALEPEKSGRVRVIACAITHSRPTPPTDGVLIPPKVLQHLGLDGEPSWIITTEVNLLDWDDPGVVPATTSQWIYGYMPAGLLKQVSNEILRLHSEARLPFVNRPEIEAARSKRGQ